MPLNAERLVLVGDEGTEFTFEGRRYRGPIDLTAHADGIAVVETVQLDDYLAGIREVPFSWHEEALAAQAIAARTYLAWTLVRGRTRSGITYDYDICATTTCQVYAGAGVVDREDGDAAARVLVQVDVERQTIECFEHPATCFGQVVADLRKAVQSPPERNDLGEDGSGGSEKGIGAHDASS